MNIAGWSRLRLERVKMPEFCPFTTVKHRSPNVSDSTAKCTTQCTATPHAVHKLISFGSYKGFPSIRKTPEKSTLQNSCEEPGRAISGCCGLLMGLVVMITVHIHNAG